MAHVDDRNEDAETGESNSGTIPTDTAGDSGIGTLDGVSGMGSVGPDFGIAGNVPEPPGADEEAVVFEDEDEDQGDDDGAP